MSMTIKNIKELAVKCFAESGSPSPESDAEILLEFFLERDYQFIRMHYWDTIDESRCNGFFELMDRHAAGVPVQHITGEQEFMGIRFHTTADALIPRQDTEILVESVLDDIKNRKAGIGGLDVLDLCTGSGCIAVSLAKLAPKKVHLTAIDLSPKALALAKENAEKNDAGSIKFSEGDLFAPLRAKKTFDIIVSNPPYIPSAVIPTLGKEVKDHEPLMALDGGEDGLAFYRRILNEGVSHLVSGGLLALEIGADQGVALLSLAAETGAFTTTEIKQDLAGLDRVFLGIRK